MGRNPLFIIQNKKIVICQIEIIRNDNRIYDIIRKTIHFFHSKGYIVKKYR